MEVVGIIFRKEIRDMFRDKRVRSAALVMPSAIIFMMMYFFGFISDTVKPSHAKVYVVGKNMDDLAKAMQADQIAVVKVDTLDEGQRLIREGKAHVVLNEPSDNAGLGKLVPRHIDAYIDPKQERSEVDLHMVSSAIDVQNDAVLKDLLVAHGIPSSAAKAIQLDTKEIQVGAKSSPSQFVLQLLPYLIVIWAFYGGMSTATELVAGEKDKSTLETLLISPASRTQIAVGKFLSLSFVCLVSSLSCFIGLVLAQQAHVSEELQKGLGITPASFAVIVAVLVPTVALFASILLAISTYAKNPREAQTYLTGVSLLVLMPAMFSQFIGFTDFASASWLYSVPVLNTATIVRQALLGQMNTNGILTCIGISVVLAAIAIYLAVKLFNRESVLVRV